MAVYKRGDVWWFKFTWNGELIRETTKQGNKRTAEQIESARKTGLAKGEVGIRDRKPVPTLKQFAELDYLPYVETRFAEKRSTLAYCRIQTRHLIGHSSLASAKLDAITPGIISGFIEDRRNEKYEVSSINRSLQVLRRMLHLAVEWGRIDKSPAKVSLVPGEQRRERVLSLEDETAFLQAATIVGESIIAAHLRALEGIRAVKRGERPIQPQDPYLLRDVSTVLLDCGLRPEECYRMRWEHIRRDTLHVPYGKTVNARREIPLSERVAAILEARRGSFESEWVFPAGTRSGHIEQSTLKKAHAQACKGAKLVPFVPYIFRHTCLTRWSAILDPYTLAYLAGHSDFGTTKRYVHPSLNTAREAIARARKAQSGHKIGHSAENADTDGLARTA